MKNINKEIKVSIKINDKLLVFLIVASDKKIVFEMIKEGIREGFSRFKNDQMVLTKIIFTSILKSEEAMFVGFSMDSPDEIIINLDNKQIITDKKVFEFVEFLKWKYE